MNEIHDGSLGGQLVRQQTVILNRNCTKLVNNFLVYLTHTLHYLPVVAGTQVHFTKAFSDGVITFTYIVEFTNKVQPRVHLVVTNEGKETCNREVTLYDKATNMWSLNWSQADWSKAR